MKKNISVKTFMGAVCLIIAVSVCSLLPAFKSEAKKPALDTDRLELKVGESARLYVSNVSGSAKVKFRSGDKNIAGVSKDGNVTAKAVGTTTIKAVITKKNGKKKKLFCVVNVSPKEEEKYEPELSPLFTGNRNGELSDSFCSEATDFAVRLFRADSKDPMAGKKNYLISPLSVLTDMMMAANGAEGETLGEMEKVMCGSVPFEAFKSQLSDYNARLIWSDSIIFRMANSIWIRDDADRLNVKESFLKENEKYFNAESYTLAFDTAMMKKVNDWVNKNTRGMIPELMKEPPSDDDVMHLINAIAFEAEWMNQYEDYMVNPDQTFTNAAGNKEKATMLCDKQGSFLSGDKAVGFKRTYKGGDYSFVAILPDEGVSAADYLESMTGASFTAFLNSVNYGYDVYTRMPEFTFDYSTEMSKDLYDMGIKKAFLENADFSKMAETKTGKLFIGQVVHKTHIELDRKGTKAAAVTDISMKDNATAVPEEKPVIRIYLDRPFICAIVQNETGIPVFMGVVNSVE